MDGCEWEMLLYHCHIKWCLYIYEYLVRNFFFFKKNSK